MTRVSVAEARRDLAGILNRVSVARERVIISRHDTDVAAVISIDDLRLLDALMDKWEDEQDIADCEAALLEAREDRISWEDIKTEFGL
ncbi:MAG: type II toxin-antitoxin system Phd/YefM family antitoxin [Coriobacteriia bacterium]|nr:type II toxin-antitoxin system Phd/YefM family antitoxin [Coriobacteriia bacterium]